MFLAPQIRPSQIAHRCGTNKARLTHCSRNLPPSCTPLASPRVFFCFLSVRPRTLHVNGNEERYRFLHPQHSENPPCNQVRSEFGTFRLTSVHKQPFLIAARSTPCTHTHTHTCTQHEAWSAPIGPLSVGSLASFYRLVDALLIAFD